MSGRPGEGSPQTALARFTAVVAEPEATLRLDEAALLLAAVARPGADVDAGLAALDDLAARADEPTLDGLTRLLFRDLGFGGNADDYYDPSNSFLDDVLRRRVGIPISLAVVVLEVGRRMRVPLAGVSMPGHFLVRDKVDPGLFLDPFNRGERLDRHGCVARFLAIHPAGSAFDDAFLEPVGTRTILARMLANLDSVATMRADRPLLLRVLQLKAALPGASVDDKRRLAASLAASGQLDVAARLLESLDMYADAARLWARLN